MECRAFWRPRAALLENVKDLDWHLARQLLDYDSESGELIWVYDWSWAKAHSEAGVIKTKNGRSYRVVGFDDRKLLAHQLIWFWITAEWAPIVDHVDGNGLNNAQRNLRAVTSRTNAENRHRAAKNSKTGLLGVYPHGKGYRAEIVVAGQRKRLGYFKTAEAAHTCYVDAKRTLHPGCVI